MVVVKKGIRIKVSLVGEIVSCNECGVDEFVVSSEVASVHRAKEELWS